MDENTTQEQRERAELAAIRAEALHGDYRAAPARLIDLIGRAEEADPTGTA